MEWIRSLKTVLAYIEENLRDEISIEEMSGKVYISPFYLQKGFRILTGYSVGEYIRNRRLYEAAADISRGDKIIDVAGRYGYETQESFTKAFTRFHGATPGKIRKDFRQARIFLPMNIHIEITGGEKMDYTVSPMWGFKVIGFEREFTYDEAYEKIPAFWDEIFDNSDHAENAPACPEAQAIKDYCIGEYGVCIDDVGEGKFRYLIAGKYTGGDVPASMTLFEFPQGEWAKFSCTGPMPHALQALNTHIFREWLPGNPEFEMSGCYNVEWYSCDGEKSDPDYKSGIWIPVRRYADEAAEKWGDTEAYKENAKKSAARSKQQNKEASDGMMEIFARFGEIKGESPASPNAKKLAAELKKYITDNFYNCTDEIFSGLADMYCADGRFKENIDRKGGAGTAEFAAKAIKEYLK